MFYRKGSFYVSCTDRRGLCERCVLLTNLITLRLQYGICFDIDGVICRGVNPIPEAVEAFRMLCDQSSGRPRVPFVFLTNAFGPAHVKAKRLQDWLKCEVILLKLHPAAAGY